MTRCLLTRRRVILQLGLRELSGFVWGRDEGEAPVHRVVEVRITAASTAAVLARDLEHDGLS